MLISFQNTIKEMNQKYPDWDHKVVAFFENSDVQDGDADEGILDLFVNLLAKLIELVKTEKIAVDDAVGLFDGYACKSYTTKYINSKLRSYNNYTPLRKLAGEDIYKAKCCVDLLWSSYILRFNPHLIFDSSIPMNETEFKKLAVQLDRFVNFCVDRSYSLSAITQELKEDANLEESFCEYIAKKIDEDFEKLKLNFVIHRLSVCERTLEELSEKWTHK